MMTDLRRLERLKLLDNQNRIRGVDAVLEEHERAVPLERPAARKILRKWLSTQHVEDASVALRLLALEHMRKSPVESASILQLEDHRSFARTLTECALHTARKLYDVGRSAFADGLLDYSISCFLEAGREFLFVLSSGLLFEDEEKEARGKYAVGVAFASRWMRIDLSDLQRALTYHEQSMAMGNVGTEAKTYYAELLLELFNRTGQHDLLDQADHLAQANSLPLVSAEIGARRLLLSMEARAATSMADVSAIIDLVDNSYKVTGVQYVQAKLIEQFSMAVLRQRTPLGARQVRFPFGFLSDLPSMSDRDVKDLFEIVLAPLEEMQQDLEGRGKRPNLAAQYVVIALLRSACSRDRVRTTDLTTRLVDAAARLASSLPDDRYAQWQLAEARRLHALATHDDDAIERAMSFANALCDEYPKWPLPLVTLAQIQDISSSSAWHPIDDPWEMATALVIDSQEYRRTDLGGRSGVFAIDDARGDLASTLVFKGLQSIEQGSIEADNMARLSTAIHEFGLESLYGVPRSVAIVSTEGGPVHVIERELGTVLSSLPPSAAMEHLPECVQLLGLYHQSLPMPDQNRSGWGPIRRQLGLWCRTLLEDEREKLDLIEKLRLAFPQKLPVVTKRDGHLGNWVLGYSGRLVAIDLEGSSPLPVGYDVAQLIEDYATLGVDEGGFGRRYELLAKYLEAAGIAVDLEDAKEGYDWCALTRALWLATSRSASRARHVHARRLAQYIATHTRCVPLRSPARHIAEATRAVAAAPVRRELTGHQIRISRAMSLVLRHRAPSLNLGLDEGGFVDADALAEYLDQPLDAIQDIASHPAEPRFQLERGKIRALYGHTFAVPDMHELNVALPDFLYHGTSWSTLDSIVTDGLQPMGRQHVYLTNDATEALEVARRHGRATLLGVPTSGLGGVRAVADAVWAADSVPAVSLEVRNPYGDLAVVPPWLTGRIDS